MRLLMMWPRLITGVASFTGLLLNLFKSPKPKNVQASPIAKSGGWGRMMWDPSRLPVLRQASRPIHSEVSALNLGYCHRGKTAANHSNNKSKNNNNFTAVVQLLLSGGSSPS